MDFRGVPFSFSYEALREIQIYARQVVRNMERGLCRKSIRRLRQNLPKYAGRPSRRRLCLLRFVRTIFLYTDQWLEQARFVQIHLEFY